jgi:hypothetical protein
MGRLKYPSSANPSDEDACAVWLHRSAILGSAALGEAADAMVGLCFVCIYRILTREYLSHLIFILIPLWRGFYFSEDMLSDVHTVDVSYRRTKPWCVPRTNGYLLGFPAIRCWGGDFTTVLEVAYVRSTDRNCMIFLS